MTKNRKKGIGFVLVGVLMCGVNAIAAPSNSDVVGIWQGKLSVSGTSLTIVFKITQNPDRTLTGTLDSPDQGATGIPATKVVWKNDSLTLEVKTINGVYNATLVNAGRTLDGTWQQNGLSFPLKLDRTDKPAEVRRPQEPKRPYPYLDEEVTYENKADNVTLAGTLTLPRGKGPFPAVILITGSGPQDRDEAILGHKPFLVIADYLTRRGIAVLRSDDRGVGKSTGRFGNATTVDFARDVLAGVNFLKTRKEIDSKKIGLVGHSEGGLIAPMVANQSADVAFIVLLAGPGVPGEQTLYDQARAIAKAEGTDDSAIAVNQRAQAKIFAIVRQEPDSARAAAGIRAIIDSIQKQLPEEEQKAVESTKAARVQQVLTPWFRFFLTYDPRPALRKVKVPVLAIDGEKDLQVDARTNLAAIAEALKQGGNTDFTMKELPGLNHLFQTSATGAFSEYARIEETFAPGALRVIGDWIEGHTKK